MNLSSISGFTKADVGDMMHVYDRRCVWWWRPLLRLRVKVPMSIRQRYPKRIADVVHRFEDAFCFYDGPTAGHYRIESIVSETEVTVKATSR